MRRLLASAAALLVLAACGGSSTGPDAGPNTPPPPPPPPPPGGSSQLAATIDGQQWSATSSLIYAIANTSTMKGGLTFSGSVLSPSRGLTFTLARIKGPGTYPLGVNIGTNAGGILLLSEGSQSWSTPLNGDAGTVTITSMSNGRVVGTFSAELESQVGTITPAKRTVSNGSFNVPINPGYTAPPADDLGSVISGTIDGRSFKGATIVGLGGGTSLMGFSASNTEWNVNVSLGPVDGTGTLPISNGLPVRKITVLEIGSSTGYGGTAADEGTMTVTSVTANRIAGSFSATLARVGGAGSIQVSGTFDVRTAQ